MHDYYISKLLWYTMLRSDDAACPGKHFQDGRGAGSLAQGVRKRSQESSGLPFGVAWLDVTHSQERYYVAQLRFQLAHILVSVEDLEGALKALLLVKEIAPKEPPVHALLGQVYHRLGPK